MPVETLCGTYEVLENRATRTGRKIPLRVVVLPATGPQRLPDPFVYFAGGPGDASIPGGVFMARQLPALRQTRDVLLVDYRGTGESGALTCPELGGAGGVQGVLDDFLPLDKIRACRDRLKQEVDLSWYTTDAAVDDIEEVRTALGYGPLNLLGVSYGTRAAQAYLRRHPGSVRTVVLEGVVAPDERLPLGLARASQEALDGLFAECEGDPACRGAFPRLRQEVDAVLRRATAEPVRVELTETGQPFEIRLGRGGVVQTLRYRLYSPDEAALLPLEVHLAAQGDWKPLAHAARIYGDRLASSMAQGFFLSVTCAEDLAFIREEEAAAAVAGTFVGDFRVRAQKAACEGWPTRDLGADHRSLLVSDVPALLISGERDPATPAADARRVARSLKRARHLVIADGGHGIDGMRGEDCYAGLVTAFIEAGTTEGLDTSCIARLRRPEFALTSVLSPGAPEAEEVTVTRAGLERLPGIYANQDMGLTVRVELQESQLRVSITAGPPFPPFRLIPVSPTRFRAEGEGLAPGLMVGFQMTEGKATAFILAQPGMPEAVLPRTE
jgi:pimeloyl-ACP methyl ester carboxylesterase